MLYRKRRFFHLYRDTCKNMPRLYNLSSLKMQKNVAIKSCMAALDKTTTWNAVVSFHFHTFDMDLKGWSVKFLTADFYGNWNQPTPMATAID